MADNAKPTPSEESKPEEKVEEKALPVSQEAKPEVKKPEGEAEAPLQVPDRFKDKSPEDIAKSYVELEKKWSQQSSEIGEARKFQEQANVLLQTLADDPELYKKVEGAIQKRYGVDPISGQTQPKRDVAQGQKEAGKGPKDSGSDVRRHLENQIISGFQHKFGLNKLPPKERQESMQKVSTAWAEMLDPKGVKTKQELLASVDLDSLPKQLENAYWLNNKDALIEKGTLPTQDPASIGSMPSSTGKSGDGVQLTPKQRATSEKLGVDTESYAKQQQKINKEE